jgi:uncharacterized protein involved in type VI secretion and phage assembly
VSAESAHRYLGKYRGTVVNNIDPMQSGRLQAQVPDVLGESVSSWAMPCVPVAGLQMGSYFVPPIGAGVWIEFEQGDADYPIWTGCWWSTGQVPGIALATPPALSQFLLQTQNQNALLISDAPGPTGGFLLKTTTGALIAVNDTGITISNGKGATITMNGPTVAINGAALVVT